MLALGALALSTGARAQLGASVEAETDYRFRGLSLSGSHPSQRLTLNFDAANACYGGLSATGVALGHADRYVQWLGYAGCVRPWDSAHQFEIGANATHFSKDPDYDFVEAYAGLLAERWSARAYLSPDYFGRRVPTLYAEFNGHRMIDARWRLFGHLGGLAALDGANGAHGEAGRARFDLRLGAGLALADWDLQLAWVGATPGGPYPAPPGSNRQAWVASLAVSF